MKGQWDTAGQKQRRLGAAARLTLTRGAGAVPGLGSGAEPPYPARPPGGSANLRREPGGAAALRGGTFPPARTAPPRARSPAVTPLHRPPPPVLAAPISEPPFHTPALGSLHTCGALHAPVMSPHQPVPGVGAAFALARNLAAQLPFSPVTPAPASPRVGPEPTPLAAPCLRGLAPRAGGLLRSAFRAGRLHPPKRPRWPRGRVWEPAFSLA